MFTTEELQAIDRKYFTVIVADAYDVTLISNNTKHVWFIIKSVKSIQIERKIRFGLHPFHRWSGCITH